MNNQTLSHSGNFVAMTNILFLTAWENYHLTNKDELRIKKHANKIYDNNEFKTINIEIYKLY